jgi:Lrp/AsnC family transcriptional regulator, leucine-responsive regulatory protein
MRKKTIDFKNVEILNILADHAELTNTQLSELCGLSEGPTLVRVQSLWKRGVIKSYEAVLRYQFLGYNV